MSPGISEVERRQVLSEFMNTLRLSGNDPKYRVCLLKGILDKLKRLTEKSNLVTELDIETDNRSLTRKTPDLENIRTLGSLEVLFLRH